jgi:hypothetical protein
MDHTVSSTRVSAFIITLQPALHSQHGHAHHGLLQRSVLDGEELRRISEDPVKAADPKLRLAA